MQDSSPHHPFQFLVPKFNFRFLQAAAGERRHGFGKENIDKPDHNADMIGDHPGNVRRNETAHAEISAQSGSRKFKTCGYSETQRNSSGGSPPRYMESAREHKKPD